MVTNDRAKLKPVLSREPERRDHHRHVRDRQLAKPPAMPRAATPSSVPPNLTPIYRADRGKGTNHHSGDQSAKFIRIMTAMSKCGDSFNRGVIVSSSAKGQACFLFMGTKMQWGKSLSQIGLEH